MKRKYLFRLKRLFLICLSFFVSVGSFAALFAVQASAYDVTSTGQLKITNGVCYNGRDPNHPFIYTSEEMGINYNTYLPEYKRGNDGAGGSIGGTTNLLLKRINTGEAWSSVPLYRVSRSGGYSDNLIQTTTDGVDIVNSSYIEYYVNTLEGNNRKISLKEAEMMQKVAIHGFKGGLETTGSGNNYSWDDCLRDAATQIITFEIQEGRRTGFGYEDYAAPGTNNMVGGVGDWGATLGWNGSTGYLTSGWDNPNQPISGYLKFTQKASVNAFNDVGYMKGGSTNAWRGFLFGGNSTSTPLYIRVGSTGGPSPMTVRFVDKGTGLPIDAAGNELRASWKITNTPIPPIPSGLVDTYTMEDSNWNNPAAIVPSQYVAAPTNIYSGRMFEITVSAVPTYDYYLKTLTEKYGRQYALNYLLYHPNILYEPFTQKVIFYYDGANVYPCQDSRLPEILKQITCDYTNAAVNEATTLELTDNGFAFPVYTDSTYQEGAQGDGRKHFVPMWYPDGSYTVQSKTSGCWTPAGMLSYTDEANPVVIKGSLYNDWYSSGKDK